MTSIPAFLVSRKIGVIVATSGYCNARCEECVWPYMRNDKRVMSDGDFGDLLNSLKDFRIEEFALNIINEPFVDKTIGNKVDALANSALPIDVVFFSSNWLIPTENTVRNFAQSIHRTAQSQNIGRVDVNATISGTTQANYDRYQAGSFLKNTIAPYKQLDFERAVKATLNLIEAIVDQGWPERKLVVRIKAYGTDFTQEMYADFWQERLDDRGLEGLVSENKIDILVNHGHTTFARLKDRTDDTRGHRCQTGWLDTRIAIGPGGEVGLCCEDGLRSVILGNIFEQGLEGVVASPEFQQYLRVALGKAEPPSDSPCRHCQFYART